MGTVTVSRKQRLRTLEKEIRSGMEEFYYVGMKLKEIRDEELFKEDGFETWERYCKERWEWDRTYVHRLITASEYREKLPALPNGQQEWSERSVRELTRIPDKRQAARVAERIVKEIEKSHKEAAKDREQRPLDATASTVRKFVDDDLVVTIGTTGTSRTWWSRSAPRPPKARQEPGGHDRHHGRGSSGRLAARGDQHVDRGANRPASRATGLPTALPACRPGGTAAVDHRAALQHVGTIT